jgi:hypothetical protein
VPGSETGAAALVAVAAETGEMSTAVETRMVRATEAAALALLLGFFMPSISLPLEALQTTPCLEEVRVAWI